MKTFYMIFALLFAGFISITGKAQNTLSSDANTGTNTVTGTTYQDAMSSDIALTVTKDDAILVYATFSSHIVFQSNTFREAIYQITEDGVATTATSGVIERAYQSNNANDYGIGSLSHIFTAASDGTTAINLSHKTGTSGKDVTSDANLVAINIGNQPYDNINQTTSTSTSSSSFVEVATTNIISPTDAGGFLIIGALEVSGDAGVSAEWKIQYTNDGGSSWNDIGNSKSRSISASQDIGIVNLMASLPDNTSAGSYQFRVVHKADGTNTINTDKCYLTVVSLADANSSGYYYPIATTNSSSGATTTNTTTFQEVLSGSIFPTTSTSMDVLMASYYNMSGSDQINEPQFDLEMVNESGGSNPTQVHLAQTRFISDDSDVGSGASVGLAKALSGSDDYSIKLKHKSDDSDGSGTNELTTYNVGLKALGLTSTNAAAGTFPVELLSLTATKADNVITVSWATASETNNDFFEVQVSEDGYAYSVAGVVSGAGNSNERRDYEFDYSESNAIEYIRLRQVDYNGADELYGPVYVEQNNDKGHNPEVYPNPVESDFYVSFPEPLETETRIRLFNTMGQCVKEFTL
ncbi:MAG: hypothetical protein K9I29_04600, partial [Bacteroidales bacterium]|nr:hypothetical protein [Bacteroidales bacterium]